MSAIFEFKVNYYPFPYGISPTLRIQPSKDLAVERGLLGSQIVGLTNPSDLLRATPANERRGYVASVASEVSAKLRDSTIF